MDTKRNEPATEPATEPAPYLGDTNTHEIFRTRISAERRGFVFIRGNPRKSASEFSYQGGRWVSCPPRGHLQQGSFAIRCIT